MANDKVRFDVSHLENLIKNLKQDYVLRVGIIGSDAKVNHDKESGKTNAEIGTYHEFGSKDGKHPPRRSFLEDSLKFKLKFNEEQLKKIRYTLFDKVFRKPKPDLEKFLQDVGAKCLEIIEEGFATNGFGKWKPLSDKLFAERYEKAINNYNRIEKAMMSGKVAYDKNTLEDYIKQAHNPNILTDTGKLRGSISFKVFKRK